MAETLSVEAEKRIFFPLLERKETEKEKEIKAGRQERALD